MSDKKVERNVRSSDTERPVTPTQKMEAARSSEGTFTATDPVHAKGKSALLDRFREREERYRREQSLHDHEEAAASAGPSRVADAPAADSAQSGAGTSTEPASEEETA